MVDKIGWTEPLYSGRGVWGFVVKRVARTVLEGRVIDGLRVRIGIICRVRSIGGRRNHYDRCTFAGQRGADARAIALRVDCATQTSGE